MSQLSRRTFLALAAMASRGWAQPKQTSVVLLLTGVITDGGWSQLAFNGLRSLDPDSGLPTRKTLAWHKCRK